MINNTVLVGRLTKDPELRYTASGTAVATFTLAVNRSFTNQNGEREADFINCVIWKKPAETMEKYAKKGTLIGIVGRIQSRNYENQQGQRVYVTEVVAGNFQLLESRQQSDQRGSGNSTQQDNHHQTNGNYGGTQAPIPGMDNYGNIASSDPFTGSSIDISDDDLPF